MSEELPTLWAKASLGDVVDVLDNEREPVNAATRADMLEQEEDAERFPYFGATGQVGWINSFRSEGERTLLGEDGAPFLDQFKPKAYVVSGRFWVNNHAHVLRGKAGVLDSRFLCHQLNTVEYQPFVTGTTRMKLTSGAMRQIPLRIAPIAEQLRVVVRLEELLSDLESGVAELQAAQKKLAQYRQSLLKAAVEGALTADWRAQNPPQETGAELLARILRERRARWEARQLEKFKAQGKEPPKEWQRQYPAAVEPSLAGLPVLPSTWTWASLDMLGAIASGVAKGSKVSRDKILREIPYLRVANVQRGYLDLGEIKTILATERDISDLILCDGDVLFNEGGDRDKLGRGWVWRNEMPECIHQNHVFRMRPYLNDTESEFVSHHGNTFGQRWFELAGKQTTNLASINMGLLRSFPVPVPPVAEQKVIVESVRIQLDAILGQQRAIERGLHMASAQRQNILRAAFSGQLVPHDPADEPASVLLARIREQRAATQAGPQRRKPRVAREPE